MDFSSLLFHFHILHFSWLLWTVEKLPVTMEIKMPTPLQMTQGQMLTSFTIWQGRISSDTVVLVLTHTSSILKEDRTVQEVTYTFLTVQ